MMPVLEIPRADEYLRLLEERLPEKTLRHTLSVASMMHGLVDKAGIERVPAITAGLLHDYCKAMKPDALLAAAEAYGVPINDAQRRKPNLLHGPVAAEEVKREHGVDDEDVYEAIYWHTTGKPGLGRVGQALYLADFCEPMRTISEAADARRILERDGFDAALLFAARKKVAHVRTKSAVDPNTEAFVEWLESEFVD